MDSGGVRSSSAFYSCQRLLPVDSVIYGPLFVWAGELAEHAGYNTSLYAVGYRNR